MEVKQSRQTIKQVGQFLNGFWERGLEKRIIRDFFKCHYCESNKNIYSKQTGELDKKMYVDKRAQKVSLESICKTHSAEQIRLYNDWQIGCD